MARRHAHVPSTLGTITLVADDTAIVGLYFPDHRHSLRSDALGKLVTAAHDPLLARARRELDEYLAGDRRHVEAPLAVTGDAFSERVWRRLREIPYGSTTTYGAIADELGNRRLAQRVGQAVGRNPICVFIPCHRVLGADGSLTGYAGGLDRKRALLDIEEPTPETVSRLF